MASRQLKKMVKNAKLAEFPSAQNALEIILKPIV
jgi:hypothetical protein